jgi:transcriptional regulator with XRE-family HTH domain
MYFRATSSVLLDSLGEREYHIICRLIDRGLMIMPQTLGDVIKQARQTRRLTLRRLADQVTKEDGTPISPQYLNDIELHHRLPTPHVLRDLARVLALDYDTLLASAGAADVVVREYLAAYPQHAEAIIKLFRVAQQQGFQDWHDLRQRIERKHKGAR